MSTRDQILEIAYRAFAEKGYNHTSMGAIAEELGITRPALYYHFSSKEDLLLATYEMIDPLINVSADEALGCTEPAEFKQAFAALIASITSNLRNVSSGPGSLPPSNRRRGRFRPSPRAPRPSTTRPAPYSQLRWSMERQSAPFRPTWTSMRPSSTWASSPTASARSAPRLQDQHESHP